MQAGRHEKIVEPVQRWGKSPSERRGYLKERNLFAIRRILVILGARAVLMPLAPVRVCIHTRHTYIRHTYKAYI